MKYLWQKHFHIFSDILQYCHLFLQNALNCHLFHFLLTFIFGRLKAAGLKVRFCTNETQCTRQELVNKLSKFGYKLSPDELFAPAPAARRILQQRNLRPHLLVHPGNVQEFDGIDQSNPNCVVIGDATDQFSYENMNSAFGTLIGLEKPVLISMGYG